MDLALKGKNAIVCGASKGLGKAAALKGAALRLKTALPVKIIVRVIEPVLADRAEDI